MESDLVKHGFLCQFILISYRKKGNCQLLTRIKKQRLKCLRLIQFSGVSCSLGLFMSCNPKQNLIQNIFTIFRKNEENPEGFCQTRVSWPILAYMCFILFRFLYLSAPVNNFSVMSGRSHRTLGITNRLLLGGKCILL